MEWRALLEDLEAQFDGAHALELATEVADRTRREAARLRLVDRLAPAVGAVVGVAVGAAGVVRGELLAVGSEWALLAEPAGREALVPLAGVSWVEGLSIRSREPLAQAAVESRLGLGHALRALARSRAVASVVLRDGTVLVGTLDRVGHDFVEITDAAGGEQRRPSRGQVRTIPHGALALLRS
ncbi:MAG: hypothetical protein ACJ74O_14880 [Frankiaceae bacterium]